MTKEQEMNLAHIENYHNIAMNHTEQAFFEKSRNGESDQYRKLNQIAFENEKKAVDLILSPPISSLDNEQIEPTKSIMLYNCAVLAFECDPKKHKKLIKGHCNLVLDAKISYQQEAKELLKKAGNF